jgi:cation-transporting ATPase 13A2
VRPTGNAETPLSKLEWSCMDYPGWKLDDYSLRPLAAPAHLTVDADEEIEDYALVLTGDVFRWIVNHAAAETMHRVCCPVR